MVGLVFLVSSAFFISQFISTTIATPIESYDSPDVSVKALLVARQKGTYSGTDANVNASLVGTYNCFKGGTWARQTECTTPIQHVCGEPVYDVHEFTPFSLQPNADGAYNPQQTLYQLNQACFDISANCDDTPQSGKANIYFDAHIGDATHANTADCVYAMGRIRDLCHGDNGWTRGGWFTFTDGTSYGLDPQTNGKNE